VMFCYGTSLMVWYSTAVVQEKMDVQSELMGCY